VSRAAGQTDHTDQQDAPDETTHRDFLSVHRA
jgi:hypothetical protein